MFRFLWILIVCASFQCYASTCLSDTNAEFALGEKHRAFFKFSFWETHWAMGGSQGEQQVIFYIEAPARLNDDNFNGMLLAKGHLANVPDGYGVFVAVFPHETQKHRLTSTINMKKHMLEGGIISFSYGKEDCEPSYSFKVSDLLKDKNNWNSQI
jgi:hypothetical protein